MPNLPVVHLPELEISVPVYAHPKLVKHLVRVLVTSVETQTELHVDKNQNQVVVNHSIVVHVSVKRTSAEVVLVYVTATRIATAMAEIVVTANVAPVHAVMMEVAQIADVQNRLVVIRGRSARAAHVQVVIPKLVVVLQSFVMIQTYVKYALVMAKPDAIVQEKFHVQHVKDVKTANV